MKVFKSLSSYEIEGMLFFSVYNPETCHNFDKLKGSRVIIDECEYLIKNVEHSSTLPPFRKGEMIGLMVCQ